MTYRVEVEGGHVESFEYKDKTYYNQTAWLFSEGSKYPEKIRIQCGAGGYAKGFYTLEMESLSVYQGRLKPRLGLKPIAKGSSSAAA